ncbi:type II secretion system GspH family protein [Patescibacteria group bacterium]|nr:type II secretion system GspH family protein [Patescibacteria group bacterium]
MMKGKKEKAGFTIIELMVVVAAAAMILSFVTFLFVDSKKRSRDSRRERDMKELQNALNLYAGSNQLFPVCGRIVIDGSADCLSSVLISGEFVVHMSADPLDKGEGSCGVSDDHVYCYTSEDGFGYILEYNLETDSILGKSAGWQTIVVRH